MRGYAICLFLILFVYRAVSQVSALLPKPVSVNGFTAASGTNKLNKTTLPRIDFMIKQPEISAVKILPANYYKGTIGFFCIKELQVEKTIKVPFRFRLGSTEYCNRMEGKNRQ